MTIQVIGTQQLDMDKVAKAIVLQDKNGMLQVLIPSNCLLDLASLNDVTGRDLKAISLPDLIESIYSKKIISHTDLPGVNLLDTVIDKRLLQESILYLIAEDEHKTVRLDQAEFRRLLKEMGKKVASVSCAVEALPLLANIGKIEMDLEQITHAVKTFTGLRIRQRLEETLEIPPLPQTAHRIIQLRADPHSETGMLSEIVESDASLSAQVVSWAASPYYAAPGKIQSVDDAIIRVLGFDLVSNLALGLSLGKSLSVPKDSLNGFTPYWQQSVYCAAVVEGLVSSIPIKFRPGMGMAYLSGLLQNFGFLILAFVFPPQFSLICRYMEANPHISHEAIELFILQVTREQMCSWLMNIWQMPPEVCTALRFQHNPEYDGEQWEYANVLFLATRLLRKHHIGDSPPEDIPPQVYEKLHISPEKAEDVVNRILISSDELKEMARNLAC